MENEDVAPLYVIDELGSSLVRTLELYEVSVTNGRYSDAVQCLNFVSALTNQIHNIEERAQSTEYRLTMPMNISVADSLADGSQ